MITIGDQTTGGSTHSHPTGQGFIDYNDATTSTMPIVLVADTWTTLTNDGLGTFTNKLYSPSGVSELMDVSNGSIDLSELQLGDSVIVRNDFTVTPTTNNQIIEMRYTLGTGGAAYTLEKSLGRMDTGGGNPVRFSLTADYIYAGDTNTRDNPIFIQIKTSGAGSVVNAGSVIQVINR